MEEVKRFKRAYVCPKVFVENMMLQSAILAVSYATAESNGWGDDIVVGPDNGTNTGEFE